MRGPIPTRRRAVAVAVATAAASETSVQSPLWKKNTSLAPALFLLFLSFCLSVYLCLFSEHTLPPSAPPNLPRPSLRCLPACSFFFVQWLVPSCSFSSGSSFFRGSPAAISLLYIRCQAEQCNVIQVQGRSRIESTRGQGRRNAGGEPWKERKGSEYATRLANEIL